MQERRIAGGAPPASGSDAPPGAHGPESAGGDGRGPVREVAGTRRILDPPTATASVFGVWLAVSFILTGFSFHWREFAWWPKDPTINDFVGDVFWMLSLFLLFAPIAVGILMRKRRGPSGGSIALTWFVLVPALFVLLGALSSAYVPHASPHIAPFWFAYGVAMPLQAIGDGFIWLVGLLFGGQLR